MAAAWRKMSDGGRGGVVGGAQPSAMESACLPAQEPSPVVILSLKSAFQGGVLSMAVQECLCVHYKRERITTPIRGNYYMVEEMGSV